MPSSKYPIDEIPVPQAIVELQYKFEHIYCNIRRSQDPKGYPIHLRFMEYLVSISRRQAETKKPDKFVIHFQGYGAEKGTGTMIVEATVNAFSDGDIRLDFKHPPVLDEIHGCPNFWESFILAIAPVIGPYPEYVARRDPEGAEFVRVVEKTQFSSI